MLRNGSCPGSFRIVPFFSSFMRSEEVSHSAAASMSGHAARTSRKRARESGDVAKKTSLVFHDSPRV